MIMQVLISEDGQFGFVSREDVVAIRDGVFYDELIECA
jgi:hypothetical protein